MTSIVVSTWTQSTPLPYPPHDRPLLPSAVGNTTQTARKEKPRLRLPTLEFTKLPSRRFDPFADEPTCAGTSQLPPLPSQTAAQNMATRGRGRCRSSSFTAGPNTPRSACTSLTLSAFSSVWTPSPAPSLSRPRRASSTSPHGSTPVPAVPLAPTPFHARHYPTPDARARLLARTLLNRIHAVGRPRSPYCSSSSKPSAKGKVHNGYESESGSREYVPSRLSECIVA
ncbi:hypothetical protein C8R43DRAFT_1016190 [Mycena crocata]|nr:hypothetical protein C8R43DRAFT_1016190 [Mycena crocata]